MNVHGRDRCFPNRVVTSTFITASVLCVPVRCTRIASGSMIPIVNAWQKRNRRSLYVRHLIYFWVADCLIFDKAEAAHVPLSMATDVGGGTSFSMLQTMNETYKVARMGGRYLPASSRSE